MIHNDTVCNYPTTSNNILIVDHNSVLKWVFKVIDCIVLSAKYCALMVLQFSCCTNFNMYEVLINSTSSSYVWIQAFAIFCGLGIHNTQMYENAMRLMAKQQVALDVLSYHATAQPDEVSKLKVCFVACILLFIFLNRLFSPNLLMLLLSYSSHPSHPYRQYITWRLRFAWCGSN